MTSPLQPRYLDAGETALVVEFGTTIDEGINDCVLALDAAIAGNAPAGVVELVPTYRSLMIHYDPLILPRRLLIETVEKALQLVGGVAGDRRLWTLPACYDKAFAEDLEVVAASAGLSTSAVINYHASARYRVFMYGFAPGCAYLGGSPKILALPRRATPRQLISPGSLTIAGGQSLVSTVAMPSGWHIVGRTPERLFAPRRNPVFLITVGDVITFEPVDRADFEELGRRAERGEIISRSEALS